jgi:hypothetical protein
MFVGTPAAVDTRRSTQRAEVFLQDEDWNNCSPLKAQPAYDASALASFGRNHGIRLGALADSPALQVAANTREGVMDTFDRVWSKGTRREECAAVMISLRMAKGCSGLRCCHGVGRNGAFASGIPAPPDIAQGCGTVAGPGRFCSVKVKSSV